MFRPGTLFVLGAATSREISGSFPLGSDLKKWISQRLQINPHNSSNWGLSSGVGLEVFESLVNGKTTQEQEDLLRSARMVARGVNLSPSIDHFLELHKNDANILSLSKAMISRLILGGEYDCAPLRSPIDNPAFEEMWLQNFAHICFEGVDRSSIAEALGRFSVISFNYDRCFERFLMIALQILYDLDDAESAAQAARVPVVHPYGQLGVLPGWGRGLEVPFGKRLLSSSELIEVSNQIRTYSEGVAPGDVKNRIDRLVLDSKRVVFLGFGFNYQNIRVLTPDELGENHKRVYGTCMNVSTPSKDIITRQLESAFSCRTGPERTRTRTADAVLDPVNCGTLLELYKHVLTDARE